MNEDIISKFKGNVSISVEIDKTKHAAERQLRHGASDYISEEEIVSTAKKAIPKISELLIFDELNIGDAIHIRENDFNIIASLQEDGDNLKLVVVTVMRKQNFHPAPGQKTIVVRENKMNINKTIKEEIKNFFSEGKKVISEDDFIEKGIKNFFIRIRDKEKREKLKNIVEPNTMKAVEKAEDRAKELSAGDKMLKDDPLIKNALASISAKLKASREDW